MKIIAIIVIVKYLNYLRSMRMDGKDFLLEILKDAINDNRNTNTVAKEVMYKIQTDELFDDTDKIANLLEEMVK